MASGPRSLTTDRAPSFPASSAAIALAVVAALLAAHLLVARQSLHQASPLLLGDWLFAIAIAAALLGAHLLVARQSIHQASPLLLGDWLFAIALAAAILAVAAALGRRVGRPLADPLQAPLGEWLAALGLGYGILSQAILIAGFLRLYYGPVFLLAALALAAWLRRDLLGIAIHLAALPARLRADPLLAAARPVHRLIAITLALIVVAVFARGLIPITGDVPDWDAVAYHLAAPKIYIQLHSFVPLPDMPLANTPSAADLFSIPGLLIGSENLERYLDILLGLGLAAATYSFGARHYSRAAGLLGAVLLLHTLWVIELLPAASPDFATAFLMVLGFSDAFAALHPAPPADGSEATSRYPDPPRSGSPSRNPSSHQSVMQAASHTAPAAHENPGSVPATAVAGPR